MSCEECKKKQNLAFNKNIDQTTNICYIRVGKSNMAFVGCDKHIKQFLEERKQRR